jgi:hypothetical protein
VQDAFALTLRRDFESLHAGLSYLLERYGTVNATAARRLAAIVEGTRMEHVELKAATIAVSDQGSFEAVISTGAADRERDIVDPAGMVRALHRWTRTGKLIPLAWHHSTDPEDQIGHIDPSSAAAVNDEVVVSGWVDQTTRRGAEAWRLVSPGRSASHSGT